MTIPLHSRIQAWRAWNGQTQRGIAEAMDLSHAAISQWETGDTDPTVANLEKLCAVLGISLHEFFGPLPKQARQ